MVQDSDGNGHDVMTDQEKVERFWENPENIMRLVDLLFLFEDEKKIIPS